MDPLNKMYDAFVSISTILQQRKQTSENTCVASIVDDKNNNVREFLIDSSLSLNTNNTKTPVIEPRTTATVNDDQLHFESLTEDNFHRAHLCNRTIDELPNISIHDIKQLKLINVHTMQDLLGRFLIHETPEEFHTFLLHTFQLSEKTASIITHLLHQWTRYNLDAIDRQQK